MRRALPLSLSLSSLVACTNAPATEDAARTSDAGDDAGANDAATPPHDASTVCDVSPAPSGLPALTGEFVALDPDAGSPIPVQTGGDPTGVWRIEHATIYTAASSTGMYDPAASSIAGSAWIVVDATTLRLELSLDLVVAGTPAGTIRRHQVTDIRGTYSTSGAMLSVIPECVAPPPTMTDTGFNPQFTAGTADGTLVLVTNGMLGENTIVLTGTRMPT